MTGDWRQRAECIGTDPELYFPLGESSVSDRQSIAAAKALCARCPVQPECLQFAFTQRCMDGVWGGLTGKERARAVRNGGNSPVVDPHRVSEVAAMTRQGMTARAIGDALGMNPAVVQRYRARAREEAARTEALAFYDRPCREYHNGKVPS